MSLGVSEEHTALAASVRGWAERAGVTRAARDAADSDDDQLPGFWSALAGQDLLGLAVDEEYGGSGAGVETLAVVLDELGRALAPGPIVPTVLAARLIQQYADPQVAKDLLPGLLDGSRTAGVALTGDPAVVLGGGSASLLLLPVDGVWYAVDADSQTRRSTKGIDPSRRVAAVESPPHPPAVRRLDGLTTDAVTQLAAVLLAAEAAGVAGWCLDTAVAYAKVREQFGRPIGGFQSIKHRLADMLCDVELARAAAWDAARAVDDGLAPDLAAAIAASTALDAAVESAKSCIQVLGGIGFTWEHDAHLYLKRARASRQLLGGSQQWRHTAATLAKSGVRRPITMELPAEAEQYRGDVRDFLASIADLDRDAKRRRMADEGYLAAHWPKPYGRAAGALEQLVIDEEFRNAGVRRPELVIAAWALPPVIQYGTEAQQERFVWPSLYGEITWCQMFSEPGAGSDLANLSTAATRVEGGWNLNGQKVWTSLARVADWAICLARTNPDAPKHEGITYFLVDMKTPGLDVRPLRELTGEAMFNEVFLTDVFVPDDCVVGEVDGGWRLARTTLANERVAMSGGAAFGADFDALLAAVDEADGATLDRIGALLAHGRAEALLGLRQTLHAVSGTDPGSASSVRKLVGMHHRQDVSELALELLGPAAVSAEGEAAGALGIFLATRALTIAGGTSEVLHNVIGERILGLPRD